jgi:hypothetical protein
MGIRSRAGVLLVLGAVGLTGCQNPGTGGAVGAPDQATSTPTITPSVAVTDTPAAAPSPCRAGDVTVSARPVSPGSGHRGLTIVFGNSGGRSCTAGGYPTVVALGQDDGRLAEATHTMAGYLGGVAGDGPVPPVLLAPGSDASFVVEALAFRQSDGSAGPPYRTLVVTLPGDASSTRVAWPDTDACDRLEVHPFVPGDGGSAR